MASTAPNVEASLSDLLETALKEGPQIVSRDGVETAVIVSIAEWKRLNAPWDWNPVNLIERKNTKDPLLDPNGPHDLDIPSRGRLRSRAPIKFE